MYCYFVEQTDYWYVFNLMDYVKQYFIPLLRFTRLIEGDDFYRREINCLHNMWGIIVIHVTVILSLWTLQLFFKIVPFLYALPIIQTNDISTKFTDLVVKHTCI